MNNLISVTSILIAILSLNHIFAFSLDAQVGVPAKIASNMVPEFVDNIVDRSVNAPPRQHLQEIVWVNNIDALRDIFQLDRELVRLEMLRRVSDVNYPRRLRNLAAIVLLVRNNEIGQNHIRKQIDPLTVEGAEVLWLLGYFGLYGGGDPDKRELPDMSWAEDLMIRMLQDKRALSRDAICRCNYVDEQKMVEVRELAVTEGNFHRILAKMKSRSALPVILAAVGERVPIFDQDLVSVIGSFGDKSVEPLVLEILKAHDYRFREAVIAAVYLRMRSAVPLILDHLDLDDQDGGEFAGLEELADASDLPLLKQKLPKLKEYPRAKMLLLILKLQGGDPVPELLSFLRDAKFKQRWNVISWLGELKDDRAVPQLGVILRTDSEDLTRRSTLRALTAIGSHAAVKVLINGLGSGYGNVKPTKAKLNENTFRLRIAESLKGITGTDFGLEKNAWLKWYATNQP